MPVFTRCLTHVGSHVVRATTRVSAGVAPRSVSSFTPTAFSPSSFVGNRAPLLLRQRSSEKRYCMATAVQARGTGEIGVGDKLPDAKFSYFDADGNMKEITVDELCAGKKVIMFAVPGAFTPTCSLKHLPGFIEKSDELKAAGVDTIACVAVNDAFVLDAWAKSVGAEDKVMMLADGSGLFTKAIGVDLDLTDKGLGIRSRRYAMMVQDREVKVMRLEEGGAFTLSRAEDMLSEL